MISGHPNIWRWLLRFALGLFLGSLAPLPDLLDSIMFGVGAVIILVFLCARWWEYLHERQADQSSSPTISSSDQT